MLLRYHLDVPIFDQYNDEEEEVKVSKNLVISEISFSSIIHHKDDQLSLGQKPIEINEDSLQFSDLQKKGSCSNYEEHITLSLSEIVSCNTPTFHTDEFKSQGYDEEEQRSLDHQLIIHFSAANSKDNPQLFDLQTEGDCSKQEEENEQKSSQEQKTDIIYEEDIKQEGISSQINSLLFSELQKPVYEQIHISEGEERLKQQTKLVSFYDLLAVYMELCFSEVFSSAIFGIKANDDFKYALQVEILLHNMKCSLKFICMQRDFVNSSMLSWLHWKYDVT